jgi:hypothetical protein
MKKPIVRLVLVVALIIAAAIGIALMSPNWVDHVDRPEPPTDVTITVQ